MCLPASTLAPVCVQGGLRHRVWAGHSSANPRRCPGNGPEETCSRPLDLPSHGKTMLDGPFQSLHSRTVTCSHVRSLGHACLFPEEPGTSCYIPQLSAELTQIPQNPRPYVRSFRRHRDQDKTRPCITSTNTPIRKH